MIELLIGKKKIKLPSEFKEVPINKGIQLIQYIQKENITKEDKIVVISTLSEIEPELFYKMTEETLTSIYDNLNFLKPSEKDVYFYKTFRLNNITWGFTDFSKNKLTSLEYADIEFYLTESEYPLENLPKILTICFRPVVKKKQTIGNIFKNILLTVLYRNFIPRIFNSYQIEEYSEDTLDNSQLFGDKVAMDFGIAAYQVIMNERDNINTQFPTIFKREVDPEDEDQYDKPDPNKKPPKTFEQNWGFYHIIANLSSTLEERERWYKKPIGELLTYLSYHNQKTEIENSRIKAQQQTPN